MGLWRAIHSATAASLLSAPIMNLLNRFCLSSHDIRIPRLTKESTKNVERSCRNQRFIYKMTVIDGNFCAAYRLKKICIKYMYIFVSVICLCQKSFKVYNKKSILSTKSKNDPDLGHI